MQSKNFFFQILSERLFIQLVFIYSNFYWESGNSFNAKNWQILIQSLTCENVHLWKTSSIMIGAYSPLTFSELSLKENASLCIPITNFCLLMPSLEKLSNRSDWNENKFKVCLNIYEFLYFLWSIISARITCFHKHSLPPSQAVTFIYFLFVNNFTLSLMGIFCVLLCLFTCCILFLIVDLFYFAYSSWYNNSNLSFS